MKIGIMGGAFDPPHAAHVALAEIALRDMNLDKVLFVPNGTPPYKKCHASRADRLIMTRLAIRDRNGLEVSDVEVIRPGMTYAVDTLRKLKKMRPEDDFYYILGADAASRFGKWPGSEEIRSMCVPVCVPRAGLDLSGLGMHYLNARLPDTSSSMVRESVAEGKGAAGMTTPEVGEYIAQRGLYISAMTEEEITADLKARLNEHRFCHTLGVMETAGELAVRNDIPAGKALYAGLLHDCVKYMSSSELIKLADLAFADEIEKEMPQLLHAPVGAYMAQKLYGVKDNEVLCAIRRHTIGAVDMSLLDAIVYVADFVEPGRENFDGMDRARALAREDIFRAAGLCARLCRDYETAKGNRVHPMAEKLMRKYEYGGIING